MSHQTVHVTVSKALMAGLYLLVFVLAAGQGTIIWLLMSGGALDGRQGPLAEATAPKQQDSAASQTGESPLQAPVAVVPAATGEAVLRESYGEDLDESNPASSADGLTDLELKGKWVPRDHYALTSRDLERFFSVRKHIGPRLRSRGAFLDLGLLLEGRQIQLGMTAPFELLNYYLFDFDMDIEYALTKAGLTPSEYRHLGEAAYATLWQSEQAAELLKRTTDRLASAGLMIQAGPADQAGMPINIPEGEVHRSGFLEKLHALEVPVGNRELLQPYLKHIEGDPLVTLFEVLAVGRLGESGDMWQWRAESLQRDYP